MKCIYGGHHHYQRIFQTKDFVYNSSMGYIQIFYGSSGSGYFVYQSELVYDNGIIVASIRIVANA